MGYWVHLREALMNPRFGAITDRQINYKPDQRSVELSRFGTGYKKKQTFSTEEGHTWYPFTYEGEVYLIAGEETKQELCLHGLGGYIKGIGSINKITGLYGSDSLGAYGIGLTLKFLYVLPKHMQEIDGRYWLCEKFNILFKHCHLAGLHYVDSGSLYRSALHASDGDTDYYSIAVRPLVHLGSNTEVYIDDSDKPLEIRIG